MSEVYVPIESVAEQFSVSKHTIRKWVKSRTISEKSFIKVGNTYRFMMSSVLSDLQGQSSTETPQFADFSGGGDRSTFSTDPDSHVETEKEAKGWEVACKNLFWQFKLYEKLIDKFLSKEFLDFNYPFQMINAFADSSVDEYEPWIAEPINAFLDLESDLDHKSLKKLNSDEIEVTLVKINEISSALSVIKAELKSYSSEQSAMLRDICRLADYFNEEIADRAFCNGSPETWEEFLEDSSDGLILDDRWQDSFESFIDELPVKLYIRDLIVQKK